MQSFSEVPPSSLLSALWSADPTGAISSLLSSIQTPHLIVSFKIFTKRPFLPFSPFSESDPNISLKPVISLMLAILLTKSITQISQKNRQ